MTAIKTKTKLNALRRHIANWRQKGETVALVPTMGAIHEGHLSLLKTANKKADRTVVSIFVNPEQFAPNEDLDRYPRDMAGDLKKLSQIGADLVWAPSVDEMYQHGFSTAIVPGSAAEGLETDFRPHFFGGVTTVCCKLFNQVAPDFATFGEKDYQQLCVIRQMVRDLNMPLKILNVATVRERSGLALSSRNAYLNAHEAQVAPQLYQILQLFAQEAAAGRRISSAEKRAQKALINAGFSRVDYVCVRDGETLGPWTAKSGRKGRVLAAAWLGKTRLIDNCAI